MSASYEQRKSILCRLCLQELENGIDIFACFPKIRLPAKMIAELLQTCVSKEDEYPQKVCSECFKKLLRFYAMSKRNDLSTCAEFVLFKEQCKIAASTIDYAKEKAECDGQHTPVSMDHSPLNLNLEELGMEDEKEFEMKQDPCYLLEAVAGILKSIRCAQMGLLPGKAEENISEDSFSLNAAVDEEFPKLCIESSDDCSDDEKQTFTAIREGVSESTTGNLAENYCKTRLRNARRPNKMESKSEERTRREEFREKNNSSVPVKSESPWKLRSKSSINDLKRHRIPRRKKPSSSPKSSPISPKSSPIGPKSSPSSPKSSPSSPKSSSSSYGSDSRHLELFSIGAGESWNSRSDSDDDGTRQLRGKKFKYRSRRVLMTEKKFECKICGRVFMLPKDLKCHMKAHTHTTVVPKSPEFTRRPRRGRVKIKEERDPSVGLVNGGVQCDSSPTTKKFTCDGCGVKFNKVGDLEIHLGQHFDVVNLICNICGVKFCRYRYMKRHLVRHLGIKMITCSQCGKSFDTQTSLRIHSAVHSTETPFDCSHCGKAFRSRMLLMVHIKTHNPVKPVQCKLCESSFVQRSDLTKHMAVHTRVRQFFCSTCGKSYLHKRNLKQHERVHDSNYKGYVCSYCGKTYLNKCDLRKHISNLISNGKIISRNCIIGRKKKAKHKLQVVIK